jgi:MFS family permease
LTSEDKGTIYAYWAVFQSLLPIVTGGLADRFGYKRSLAVAISTMMAGFLCIALLRDLTFLSDSLGCDPNKLNYLLFLFSILVLASGTALFKPCIQASIAHQLTKENSSVGWGIFYWVVNVGAFAGHFLPGALLGLSVFLPEPFFGEAHSKEAWRNLFLASAFFTSFNLLLLFTFRDVPSGASKTDSLFKVLWNTIANIFERRLLCWMAIMSCFWLMMYQLWDLQPNFIADWVDSSSMAASLKWLPEKMQKALIEQSPRGPMIPQQVLLSFNAMFIILGVVGVSWLTRHIRTLTAMLFGMMLATLGVLIAGWTQSALILIGGIVFFSLGEMMTGPKKSEYLSLIAPPGKKGLYLGYVNIPVGVGTCFGSLIAGSVYGRYGEKAVLALRYLAENTPLGQGWNGDVASLESTLGVKRTEAMAKLQEVTGLDPHAATELLWNTYSPHYVWIPFALIGVVAAIGLWVFGQRAKRWSDMNA